MRDSDWLRNILPAKCSDYGMRVVVTKTSFEIKSQGVMRINLGGSFKQMNDRAERLLE